MKKITNFLWFDKEAKEAADFYIAAFNSNSSNSSKITDHSVMENTPSGKVEIIGVDLMGVPFTLMSAGPLFKINPSVSFLIACNSKEEVDKLWNLLNEGGQALMELNTYPFSERYGWTNDKFGVSWQIMFMGERKAKQKITPTLMFVGEVCGKAEEAINFYIDVFNKYGKSEIDHVMKYGAGEAPDKEGSVRHAGFSLMGNKFAAMDSAHDHKFKFNEAVSFVVPCEDQEEIDYFWGKLSAVKESEQCGWLKDKYGLSWQIVPTILNKLLKDPKKAPKVTEAFLKMKKFDIEGLKKAAE